MKIEQYSLKNIAKLTQNITTKINDSYDVNDDIFEALSAEGVPDNVISYLSTLSIFFAIIDNNRGVAAAKKCS